MSTTWSVDAFVTNLQTAITADASWQALDPRPVVYDYWPTVKEQEAADFVSLGYDAQDSPAKIVADGTTHSRDESTSLSCLLAVRRGGSGKNKAAEARTRATVMIGHIDRILRNTPNTTLLGAGLKPSRQRPEITSIGLSQYPTLVGSVSARVCVISFTISYSVRTA